MKNAAKIAGLLGAWLVVAILDRVFSRRPKTFLLVLAGIVVAIVVMTASCGSGPLRVGTYNIRRFGVEPTDMNRLTEIVDDTRSDVLAVQEIQSRAKLDELATRLSKKRGRPFAVTLSSCGGRSKMHVGFLYDTTRVSLVGTREYPELDPGRDGECATGERPGFAATFTAVKKTASARPFALLAIHFVAGGEADKIEKRKKQWQLATTIAKELGQGDTAVAILGDTNSTGFLDDRGGERTFILDEAKRANLEVTTQKLGCSEYFQPKGAGFVPSLLDHFVATPGLARPRSVRLHGYCEKLACAPAKEAPADYTNVSDHCPVTLDLE